MKYIINIFEWIGRCAVNIFVVAIRAVIKCIVFLFSEIWQFIKNIVKGISAFFDVSRESFHRRVELSQKLSKDVRKAKKKGENEYRHAVLKFIGYFLFGEEGVFRTAFNYILPIVSIAVLLGVISWGVNLEYGIVVEYNGKEIGIISAEADFEEAEKEVKKRLAYSDEDADFDSKAKLSVKILSDDDIYVSSLQLANAMLSASEQELAEACGIYIDGEFTGAVKDYKPVKDALDDRLANFSADGIVKNISYVNKIEYTDGIYLTSSIMDENEMISLLTSTDEKDATYVVQDKDTPVTIAQKYNMDFNDFEELNPFIRNRCSAGQVVNVVEHESYLPIQYTREMETLSYLDFETIEVQTSSLEYGTKKLLVKGEKGEKRSKVEVTYVDGIESSRKTISSEITKEPVIQQMGVGMEAARPDYPDTVYNGGPLTGTGQFAWPVNGGWISDVFISNRNHMGLDIAADSGTNIYAADDGYIVTAGWNAGGYGNVVMIDHLNGYQTVYGHMSYVVATEGQYVTRGQLIGLVGSTGDSTGPHCHFEVRYLGVHDDPAKYLNTSGVIYSPEQEKPEDNTDVNNTDVNNPDVDNNSVPYADNSQNEYADPNIYDPNLYDPNAYADPNIYDPNAYVDPYAYDPNYYGY
ncbi:MAG: M23 family metallopeptidase [Ruminococcus sp.]|nr:M23 family metallopeptidase [Ruminococcus sp.]